MTDYITRRKRFFELSQMADAHTTSSTASFRDTFTAACEDEQLEDMLKREFSLRSGDVDKIIMGDKTPKPSLRIAMVRSISVYARALTEDPDSKLSELPEQYARFAEGPAFPDSLHMATERPPHRPAPTARQGNQTRTLQ